LGNFLALEALLRHSAAVQTGAKRILIVEDERITRRALEQLLGSEGYRLSTAADGAAAVAEAQHNPPDLILLDLGLPSDPFGGANFDGFGVMQWLNRMMPDAKIPVIVLTARQDAATRKTAYDLGAAVFMTKPFEPEQLFQAIRIVLGLE
jgi:two-component system OmpR family response regulator